MPGHSLRTPLLLVGGAALLAFAAALHGSFVNWDDAWLIVRNPYIRGLSHLPEILDPFGDRVLMGAEYLPVRDLSNVVDHFLFGVEPTGYRLGNWLLHGLAAGLAYVLLLEALRSPGAALAGALLWAVHPLHAEVVAWASARKDLLNAVFALLAAVLHLRAVRRGDRGPAWGAAGAFLLASLSKTSAAALPFVLAAWEVMAGDRAIPLRARVGTALRRAAPMMAVAAAGAALNGWHQSRSTVHAPWRGGNWLTNLFVMAGVHLRYLRQAALPSGMAADYAVDEEGAASAANLAGVAVLAAGLAGTAWLALRRPRAGMAALWWFGLLLPVSNVLVPIANVSADRYLFLPSLGACALLGLGWERLRAHRPRAAAAAPPARTPPPPGPGPPRGRGGPGGGPPPPRAAGGALAAVAAAFALLAARQCLVWRDGVSLWENAAAVSPGVGRVWMNRGEALAFAGRGEEALASYRRMVEVEPRNAAYWVHAGNRLHQIGGPGKDEEVERFLRTGVERADRDSGGPLVALAWLLNVKGRTAESVALLQEAVRRQPDLPQAHLNLGLWHLAERRWVRALEEIEAALRVGLPLHDEIAAHGEAFQAAIRIGDGERARYHREQRERKKALSRGE